MSKNTDLGNLVNGLFVDSSSRVGIGTTSPLSSQKLTVIMNNNTNGTGVAIRALNDGGTASQPALSFVNGSGNNIAQIVGDNGTGYLAFNTGTSNTERMRITAAGNVGIGTSSPAVRLDVTGTDDVDSSIFFRVYSNNRTVWTGLGYRRIETNSELYIVANDSTIFRNSGSERMRITSGGNVGIGNTTPSTKLHVTGTVSSVELIMSGSGSFSYSTNSSWSSHQLIVPSGVLSGGGVYLIRIQWGSGDAPYIVYATGLWQPVQSNGGSADAEVALLCSSHQGVGTAIFIRNQSVGGQATSALYARLVNFPQLVGSITTTVSRLM